MAGPSLTERVDIPGVRIGTCSWKYGSWAGLVYSAEKDINFLAEYAKCYSTVEVDQWFWSLFGKDKVSLPRRETVEEYAASVPEDFVFTVKAPNSITLTHLYKQYTKGELVENRHFLSISLLEEFLRTLDPIRANLGPIMFQLEYLNKRKMKSMKHFVELLDDFFDKAPSGYTYAIEPRNPQIFEDFYFEFLAERGLRHVFIQGYYLPEITGIYRPFSEYITGESIVRLHGYDRKKIEEKTGKRYNSIVEPMDSELPGVIEMIQDMRRRGVQVYLNVNNHYEGSAPLTIEKIESMLGE